MFVVWEINITYFTVITTLATRVTLLFVKLYCIIHFSFVYLSLCFTTTPDARGEVYE